MIIPLKCKISNLEKTFENSFKCNQRDSDLFIQTIWENTWKLTLEKVIEMQPKRLCICCGTQFEKTFENLLWKKVVKMQSMWQCICSDRQFANIWKITPEKSCSIATNATLHLFWQAIWEDVWKLTQEKNRSNSTNETMNLFWQAVSEDTWKLTLEHSWEVLGRAKRALHYNYLSLFLQERVQKRVGDKAT